MVGINIQKNSRILRSKRTYVSLLIAFITMVIFFPREGKFKYEYQKGRPWMYSTLTSPIDFPILKTQQELAKEKDALASKIVPYYKEEDGVAQIQIAEVAKISTKNHVPAFVINSIEQYMEYVYKKGILPDNNFLPSNFVQGGINDYVIIERGKSYDQEIASSMFTQSKAYKYIKKSVSNDYNEYNIDSLLSLINFNDLLIPNMVYDQQSTEKQRKQAINYISPTKGVIFAGQLLVSEGETITADIEQLLDSYRAEYKMSMGYSGSFVLLILGHILIVSVILSLFYITIFFVNFDVLGDKNKFSFLLFIVVLSFVITVIVRSFDASYLYLIPYAVFALYMMAFFQAKMVFPIYMISLLPILIIAENGVELYTLNVFAGGVSLLSFTYLNRGWLQFLSSLFIFIGMFIVIFAFRLMESGSVQISDYQILIYIFLNALFVVAAYPLLFLLEKLFSLVSVSTLRDLSDTNNKLLQELARKAPGTFQHSLQVSNMAERAVMAIRGDTRLAKVGAMYHDVGKILNPQCFIENQAPGLNYHAGLMPEESARDIIKHVDDGVELARKYNLPQIIIDFITTHHAKSQTGYFYSKFCNEGGDPDKISDFTYRGTLPTTKEQVVVMMADAVEAASRTLQDYSQESISDLVEKITRQRIYDSQLVKADISIKEINIVKSVFKKHLQDIYHARIAYPAKK